MLDRIGIVGGSAFLRGAMLAEGEVRRVDTPEGEVVVHVGVDFVFLLRHGHDGYRPPHRVPHAAHALAFESLSVEKVVGLNSIGSLKANLLPGTVVVPDDYFSFQPPPTFARDERLHIVPALDPELRRLLVESARETPGPVVDGGVYVETRGPRFETRAEIRFLATVGDVIGMTAASEATLFQERNLAYAVLGVVDNFANGVGPVPLTFEAYERQLAMNEARARDLVAAILSRRRKERSA